MNSIGSLFERDKRFRYLALEHRTTRIVKEKWPGIVGKLSKHLAFSHYKKGVVHLSVRNNAWVNELDYYKAELIKKIEVVLPKGVKVFNIKAKFDPNFDALFNQSPVREKIIEKQDLKTLILQENSRKQAQGFQKCKVCGEVLTKGPCCVFCTTS